ncbi:uncharacterized protein [Primulina huaijiensis]|uniref:uncharacterized protein n=1 Tax=Primulina huaijiensis TaxID=1492673 RepID=UPI003CC7493A
MKKGEQTKMSELEVGSAAKVLKEEREVLHLRRMSPRPDPASLATEYLSVAEEASQEVLNCIHPTLDSEEERSDVIDHLQRLIKAHVNCDVFPYGSVPLKTYLPDGDIDLTVLRDPGACESLADDVLAILRGEEQNGNSEYQINDTQFIGAEVKLVKCIVRNILVDISFNQLGGLSTLCFLEQVDRLVGRNHLFKRSVILIKTWCFYESRILGATHGLISTYALETLILYIFQLFHSAISGPLVALCMFLDYYSQFDWDNYCISLKGPVCKSSLPNIKVKMPDSGLNDLLLDEKFIENCMDMFSVPFKRLEANPKPFQPKHLNIIDPLKENNNLGRSVNRGNFFRIRSAIKFGAHKLGHVLSLPSDQVADGIKKYFANALSRHRKHSRSKVEYLDSEVGDEASMTASPSSRSESAPMYDMLLESSSSDSDNDSVEVDVNSISSLENETDRCLAEEFSSNKASESSCSTNRVIVSGNASPGDAYNAETTNLILRTSETRYLSNRKLCSSLYGNVKSTSKTESLPPKQFHDGDFARNAEKHVEINDAHLRSVSKIASSDSSTLNAIVLENMQDDLKRGDLSSIGGESEVVDCLADLSGDYDSHLRSFLCGQLTIGFSSSARALSNATSSTSRIQTMRHSVSLSQSHDFRVNPSAFSTGQTMYPVADYALPATGFYTEGRPNTRGTGTYFPSVVSGFYRSPQRRGRGKAPMSHNHSHKYPYGSGSHPAVSRVNSSGRGSHGQWRSDAQMNSPCRIEFGSIGNLAEEAIAASTRARGSSQRKPEAQP